MKDQDPELVRQRTIAQLRLWQGLGAFLSIVGVVSVYNELGRDEEWNSLVRDYIGGPDPQNVMLGVLIVVAGVALAVWATVTLRRRDERPRTR